MAGDHPQHNFVADDVVHIIMSGLHAMTYQSWLNQHGLYMFAIPESTDPFPVYAVGLSDALMERMTEELRPDGD